jgi:hypothetical protein
MLRSSLPDDDSARNQPRCWLGQEMVVEAAGGKSLDGSMRD